MIKLCDFEQLTVSLGPNWILNNNGQSIELCGIPQTIISHKEEDSLIHSMKNILFSIREIEPFQSHIIIFN